MKTEQLLIEFKKHHISPFIEVPCSLLSPVITGLMNDPECELIKPVNEAVAMGIAAGAYLSTRKIPMVLLQNSGLCNTINCLTSLNQIYEIPAVYLISWRGEPGINDAPEHDIMGAKLEQILETLDIPYRILSEEGYVDEINSIMELILKRRVPGALLLKKGLLEKASPISVNSNLPMTKSKAVDIIVSSGNGNVYFVATNGFISRELFHNLTIKGLEEKNPHFYMLGSMGHALPLAIGLEQYIDNDRRVVVLDGDGGCLMHLGAMASAGEKNISKLIHVVLDNGCYASTGGQPTVAGTVDFCAIAKGCGYKKVNAAHDEAALKALFPGLLEGEGPTFVHVLINNIEGENRSRISKKYPCVEIKTRFMERIRRKSPPGP